MLTNDAQCPACGSVQLEALLKAREAGGVFITRDIRLLPGLRESSDISLSCLECGNAWGSEPAAAGTGAFVLWKRAVLNFLQGWK